MMKSYKDDDKWINCRHIFSNGTEFEIFQWQCEKCSRYRNGKCRIFTRCIKAMFDETVFPYNDLLDSAEGYGGKKCKSFTTEKQKRLRKIKEPYKEQINICDYLKGIC